MTDFMTRIATAEDLPTILAVQKRAFSRVAAELGIPEAELPPLHETAEALADLLATGTLFIVAEAGASIVGSVRGARSGDTVEIGRLVVDDGWQRQGVATALMDLLEASYSGRTRFELFTGADAHAALALYAGRGYQVCRRERSGPVELVWLETTRTPEVR
jgi:ribosomal protein S18 acetylase RimI-like enzyme